MQSLSQSFVDRFGTLFAEGGLGNIKYLLKAKDKVALKDFQDEAAAVQASIEDDGVEVIESIDGNIRRKRFDEPF